MRRRRRSTSRGRSTRRRFLAGGLTAAGGLSILGGTQAFSQVGANRAASVGTAGDGEALLGLDIATEVQAGIDDQYLVEITNNTDETLDVTVSLANSQQGSLVGATGSLESGGSRTVSVSVAFGSETGDDALTFHVTATGGDSLNVALTRQVNVTEPPALLKQVQDQTQNNKVAFSISYSVSRLPNFDRVEIEVENIDDANSGPQPYNEGSVEGTIHYPSGGGHVGGAEGDTYQFRFRVFDQSGEYTELYTEVETTADGEGPPGDDLGDEDDPRLVEFTVSDDPSVTNNKVRLTVDYEIEQLDEFEEVRVFFYNPEKHNWGEEEVTSTDAPTGTVTYPGDGGTRGGVEGDTYEVTVDVINVNGIATDTGYVEIAAENGNSVSWPEE